MQKRVTLACLLAACLVASAFSAGFPPVHAQEPPPAPMTDPGVVPDDMLTLVVGTRFVGPAAETSAKSLFTDARIPLSSFNETDRCIDQTALEVAQEYFTTLGRIMGKAGHYYFVPDDAIRTAVATCGKLHGGPPKAWVEAQTRVVAFGRVVPTADAPALEKAVR